MKYTLSQSRTEVIVAVDESGKESFAGARPVYALIALKRAQIKKVYELIKIKKGTIRSYSNRFRGKLNALYARLASVISLVRTEKISHKIMDQLRRENPDYGLEDVSCCIIEYMLIPFIEELREKGYDPVVIYVDEPNWYRGKNVLNNSYLEGKVAAEVNCPIKVLREGELRYKLCIAAWVFARAQFLSEEEIAGPLKSGHAGDFAAQAYLKAVYGEERDLRRISHQRLAIPILKLKKRRHHIVDLSWDAPFNFRELGKGLSVPYLILRSKNGKVNEKLEYFRLDRNSYIDIDVEERRCTGGWKFGFYVPCASSTERSFGAYISDNEEICFSCKQTSFPPGHWTCFYQPKCTGIEPICGDLFFGQTYCASVHACYLALFGSKLKVGITARYSVAQRLLKQGAATAMILALVNSRKEARELEDKIYSFLQAHLSDLNLLGIKEIRQQLPRQEELLEMYYSNWDRDDGVRLRKIHELFHSWNLFPAISDCVLEEPVLLDFRGDYSKPPFLLRTLSEEKRVSGFVVGYRGPFIWIRQNGMLRVLNVEKKLLRHIVLGEFRYGSSA